MSRQTVETSCGSQGSANGASRLPPSGGERRRGRMAHSTAAQPLADGPRRRAWTDTVGGAVVIAGRSLRQGSRRRPGGSRHARLRGLSGLPAPPALRAENAAQPPLLTRYGGRAAAASGHCRQRAGPAPEPAHDQSASDAVGGTASAPARPSIPVVPRGHSSARTRYAAVIWSMCPAARSGHPTGRRSACPATRTSGRLALHWSEAGAAQSKGQ